MPQPDETAPAGRATLSGPPEPPAEPTVAEPTVAEPTANEPAPANAESAPANAESPAEPSHDVPAPAEAADLDQPTQRTPPPEATRVDEPAGATPDLAPGVADPATLAGGTEPAGRDEPTDGDEPAADGRPTGGTEPPTRDESASGDEPVARGESAGGTEPAVGGDSGSGDEPTGRDQLAPTRIAAPRWTGSAAVPPPRPRKRRWFQNDAEPADPPVAPVPRPQPPGPATARRDPTLRMPGVEADEEAIPTPVDPWAGAADDPWDAHPPYSPAGGHPGSAGHPPAEYDAPVSPPPAQRLPVTRRFPAPTGPPPPAPPQAEPPPAPPPTRAAPPPAVRRRALPPPPAPVAPPRPPKQRRRRPPDPPPAPPGWKPPRGYPPVPVRRRRRWPRVMLTLTLLSIACCCGVPAYYAKPIWEQYPASPVDPLPATVRDLRLDNGDGRQVAERLEQEVRARSWFTGGEAFAAVYRAPNNKRVTIFGSTSLRLSPQSDVETEVARLQGEYGVKAVESVPTGVRGEYRSCGTGRADGDPVVVCTWADHGSLATALFTKLSVADSSDLLSTLRAELIQRERVGSGNGQAS